MRSALLSILFVLAGAAYGQTNPHTQIRWPANCNAADWVYNFNLNTCFLAPDMNSTATNRFAGPLSAPAFYGPVTPFSAAPSCTAGTYWLAPIAGSLNAWYQCNNGILSTLGSGGGGGGGVTSINSVAGAFTFSGSGVSCTGPSCTFTGGGSPTGTAGGDLGGTYPNPNVGKVNGAAIAPNLGCLGSNSSSQLVNGSGCAALITTGLIAQYLMTDGSGTTLTDSSGNGNNCTITGATWTNSLWLTFGGTNNFISCPTNVWAGAQTVEVWFRPRNITLTNQPGNISSAFQTLMAGDTPNTATIMTDGAHPGMYGIGAQVGYMGGNQQWPTWADKWTGNTSFGLTLGSPASLYKLGRKEDVPILAVNLTSLVTTSKFYIGCNPQVGTFCSSYPYLGDVYAMRFLSAALTPQQMAQDESAMESYLLANKGLAFKDLINYDTSPIVMLGDSIIAGGAPTGAVNVASSVVGVTNSYFPDHEVWTLGIASDTAALMVGRMTTQAQPLLYRFQGIAPLLVMQGGTNDIALNNTPATTIYGYQKSICTAAHAINTKCVVTTIAAASRNTGPQEAIRTALNAQDVSGYLSGDLGADALADIGNDPILGVNLNTGNKYYYQDVVHWNPGGVQVVAGPRIALAIQSALNFSNRPFTISIHVPRSNLVATSATTGTVNLLQLGTNQKICGVTIKPMSPSKGGTLTAMTLSVGDSLGTTTTYAPAYDVLQPPSNTAFQDTPILKSASYAGGVVTGTFTSTGGNVNAVSYTDLTVDGTSNVKVTSASYPFTAADVGTDIYVSAGTGWTVGSYHVMSVASGAATLSQTPAAVSTAGGSFLLGEVSVDLCVVTAP